MHSEYAILYFSNNVIIVFLILVRLSIFEKPQT